MPVIPLELLDCVFYAYPGEDEAQRGEKIGGCGFMLVVPFAGENPTHGTLYAVTNAHVIGQVAVRGGTPTLRLNKHDGATMLLPVDDAQWVRHPDGDDLAIAQLGAVDESVRFKALSTHHLVTVEDIADFATGADVFSVGRFVTHDGRQRNTPAVRFGHVAMLPYEPILTGQGLKQESFLVDARSIPGQSGSPVFLYRGIQTMGSMEGKGPAGIRIRLLGIDYAHRDFDPVLDDLRRPLVPRQWVEQNTGMMAVVPAWKLAELLDDEDVVARRADNEASHISVSVPDEKLDMSAGG
jgi:hypothetical protein